MIYLGEDAAHKTTIIADYCRSHGITKIVLLTPEKFAFPLPGADVVRWEEIIKYKFFYRLLREIDANTLVIVNECLRTQERPCLTYNCIRQYLNQTRHQLVFQYLPLIDTIEDFMILFDFDTQSRWKREAFQPDLLQEATIHTTRVPLDFQVRSIPADQKLQAAYQREKDKLFADIGLKDPHTIPRNLYLLSGKAKLAHVDPERQYIGRNNRFKLPNLRTFKEDAYSGEHVVFEFCHNFIDFVDFLSLSRQTRVNVLVADLKVDTWYFERYRSWLGRLNDAYAALQQ